MGHDVFVTYARKDLVAVTQLVNMIKGNIPDIDIWYDVEAIDCGEKSFDDKIVKAIDTTSYVLFVVSERSLQSEWVKDEVMYAMSVGRTIIPVILMGEKMTGWGLLKFSRVNCVDLSVPHQVEHLLDNLSKSTGKKRADVPRECAWLQITEPHLHKTSLSFPDPEEDIVRCGAWNVGDYYNVDDNEGVVFWVDAEGKHGLALSLDEADLPWAMPHTYKWRHYPLIGSKDLEKGHLNRLAFTKIPNWHDRYPAFAWCADHGPGWYFPAIEEIKKFLLNEPVLNAVNHTLAEYGGKLLLSKALWECYWSSSEIAEKQAWGIDVDFGEEISCDMTHSHRVRAVLAF